MRLWSIHPQYLDQKGLTACWREGLLARHVLMGQTRGYRNHPQLERFKASRDPAEAIDAYLLGMHTEASARGHNFNREKIGPGHTAQRLKVTSGQLAYEMAHLLGKLAVRDPARCEQIRLITTPRPHPLFEVIEGDVEAWEKIIAPR